MRRRSVHLVGACLIVGALGSCGGGERQDAGEPEGRFELSVVEASFPGDQKLAKRSTLKIVVRNEETRRTVPNVAVTVRGLSTRSEARGLADPERPVFAIDGEPRTIGGIPDSRDAAPEGGETAYVDTWALGALRPGEEKAFTWKVTAVRPGPYDVRYAVAAGLAGKARAIDAEGGGRPAGRFEGEVDDTPPQSRIGKDGRSVLQGAR